MLSKLVITHPQIDGSNYVWVEDGCLVGLGKVDGLVPGVISSAPILRDPVPEMPWTVAFLALVST